MPVLFIPLILILVSFSITLTFVLVLFILSTSINEKSLLLFISLSVIVTFDLFIVSFNSLGTAILKIAFFPIGNNSNLFSISLFPMTTFNLPLEIFSLVLFSNTIAK